MYGANASGKSNFVQAIRFMRNFVLRSSAMQIGDNIDVSAFRFIEGFQEKPSSFEIIFFASDQKTYRYGFSVTNEKVIEEWLYVKSTSREICLFERREQKFDVKKKFIEGENIANKTRDNALFLPTVAQFNGEVSRLIIDWFRRIQIIDGTADQDQSNSAAQAITDEKLKRKVSDFIKNLDLSIQDVTVEKSSNVIDGDSEGSQILSFIQLTTKFFRESTKERTRLQVMTRHNKFSSDGNLIGSETVDLTEYESEGTKKLFNFAPAFLEGLENQRIFIIDELDAKLHPLLTIALIKMFHSNTGSGHCSQLVFTTHDTNLLTSELFRRDQIWFAEKDKFGATQMYSLYDFKPQGKNVRTDELYEKNYLIGKYGAIPYLGNLRF